MIAKPCIPVGYGSLKVHTSGFYPFLVKEVLSGWSCFPIRKKAKKLWMATTHSLIWAIWKERNRVVFEDVAFSPNRMKLSFVSVLISWAGLVPNVECSLARILLCIL